MKDAHAIVILPAGAYGQVPDATQRRWLSRGNVSLQLPETEMLGAVLSVIGAPVPESGMAALRFWGQTGDRSTSWMAAADPIHLEARLRDLRIRALTPFQISPAEMRSLFEMLQAELGAGEEYSFANVGISGYLQSERPIATAPVSAVIAAGHVPDRFPPSGGSAQSFHQLLGELQMLLHDHEVNIARQTVGQPAINSLWFWGGGVAPEPVKRPLPDLYSGDPLFNGFWASCLARVEPFEGFGECLSKSPRGFVAVASDAPVHDSLRSLEKLLGTGRLQRLTLLFSDGLTASLGRFDWLRVWRRTASCLEASYSD